MLIKNLHKVQVFSFLRQGFSIKLIREIMYNYHTGDFVVIYIDSLIFTNIIIDYLLLSAAVFLAKRNSSLIKLIISSIFGGFSSLYILLQTNNILIDICFKIIICGLMILIAVGCSNIRSFVYTYVVFLIFSFLLCGLVSALENSFGSSIITDNFITYFNISSVHLIICSAVIYFVITLLRKISDRSLNKHTAQLYIKMSNKHLELKGLIDTGCNLIDPFANKPVIIVSKEIYSEITDDLSIDEQIKRGRVIPYSTVNGSGIMNALRCDSIEISLDNNDNFNYNGMLIAKAEHSMGNGCKAVIPYCAIDRLSDKRCKL